MLFLSREVKHGAVRRERLEIIDKSHIKTSHGYTVRVLPESMEMTMPSSQQQEPDQRAASKWANQTCTYPSKNSSGNSLKVISSKPPATNDPLSYM